MLASLPMYGIRRADVELLWQGISRWLRHEGVTESPTMLSWPERLEAHWRNPALLLSQTCGYPLQETLGEAVEVVGAFSYLADGCTGFDYRSWLVVRAQEPGRDIDAFAGRRVAYNSEDSHSGYNALRALVAPLADNGRFFSATYHSGSHYHSLLAIKQRAADIAAIDCVTLALLRRAEPQIMDGLRIIGATQAAPGLPLISAPGDAGRLAALRRALRHSMIDPTLKAVRERLLIGDFHPVARTYWQRCTELKLRAQRYGVTRL